jgi:hypothetical protein
MAGPSTLEEAATTICRGNSCEDIIAKLTSSELYDAADFEPRLPGNDKDKNMPSGMNALFRSEKF